MIEPSPITDRLDEVLRLAALLTDQILDAQITGKPIPSQQAAALAKAARLLQDHQVEWPPMLKQALHGLAAAVDEIEPAERTPPAAEDNAGSVMEGLTRFMAAFRRERGSA